MWLKNKRDTDDLNGLWRVHDSIYDLTNFIQWHPGGQFWLEATKGTDITEAFEIHHIKSKKSEDVLKHFYIKPATKPRVSSLTFKNDGFYKTLKRNVQANLGDMTHDSPNTSDLCIDILLVTTFALASLSSTLCSFKCAFAAGLVSALTLTTAHNYIHKRNNLRMYYSDLLLIPSSDLRVMHILNHHVFLNSVIDSLSLINLFPKKKCVFWWCEPLILWPIAFHTFIILKVIQACISRSLTINADVLLAIILPYVMIVLNNESITTALMLYNFMIAIESFFFCLILFNNKHKHQNTFIRKDASKSKEEHDWGIYQLATICNTIEISDSQFLNSVTLKDRALHHLFPTLDRSVLHRLYPTIAETLKQFNVEICDKCYN
ncbi:hypothetical protein RN001_013148 [Aquatica leii]|uniref:Cytochrome b5 heme-binding domain-containing protein n=1 Tax=Aquatica leii TaxID=1421715 RepID=A0AAN7P2C3_9COLE|nr:hypothetical protein RN001_013148 [Aquatica leii]